MDRIERARERWVFSISAEGTGAGFNPCVTRYRMKCSFRVAGQLTSEALSMATALRREVDRAGTKKMAASTKPRNNFLRL